MRSMMLPVLVADRGTVHTGWLDEGFRVGDEWRGCVRWSDGMWMTYGGVYPARAISQRVWLGKLALRPTEGIY